MDPSKATRREWIGLAVLALPCLLYSMDLTVLNLALPSLSAELKPSGAQLLWIVDIYGFLVAGSLITMGTLGDRIGRRKLLMMGAAAFGAASVLAAFSKSAEMLIATRAVLGIAGATLAPSTLSLIRHMFADPEQRTFAIGVWITSYSVGGAIGPLLGGALLAHFWWGSVFLLGVPVMVLLLLVAPVLLPEYRDPNAGRPDVISAGLSLVSVLSAIYGIKRIAEHGLAWWPVIAVYAGVALAIVFVRRQKTLADPLIDLRLFRSPAFSVSLSVYMVATFVAFAGFVFLAQYLQLVLGLSPLRAGLWTLPSMLAFVVGSMLTPAIARQVRPAYVLASGLALAVVGFGMLTQIDGPYGSVILLTGFGLYSLGLAPVFTLTTDLVVGAVPPERAGAAAAISETSSELGGALGVAILGSIGMAFYRRVMAGVPLTNLSADTVEAARSTLGGAAAAAAELSGPQGAVLLNTAREAYTQALQFVSVINGGILIVTAIATVAALRSRRTGSASATPLPALTPSHKTLV